MSTLENEAGKQFRIIGTTDSNPYLTLKDMNGNDISLEDGYYVTSFMAMMQNIKTGDKITLCNPLTLEEMEITVAGMIDNDMQNAIFVNKENAAKITGIGEYFSNVVMSDTALDIPASQIVRIIKKSDVKEQFQNMSNQMNVMLYFLIGMGAVICMASIYVAMNMLVSENRTNISMLKVLGYRDSRIDRFMLFFAEFIGVLPKAYIAPQSFLYTAALTCLCYFGALCLLRRKVSRIDMVESLKGNRES